ncbi:MAG TPA: hypothetical protein VFE12_13560 [Acetobacteraceae bacterium]|nr:hypothetical protein [Acetobacteraceae bacterium]
MSEHDANAETARRRSEHEDATKKRLAEEKQAREKAHVEQRDASSAVKPTPTQAENDLAASGVHVVDHEPDGSPPDPGVSTSVPTSTRQSEAKPAAASRGNYPTRSVQPQS